MLSPEPTEGQAFAAQCLDAFNRVTGCGVADLPADAWQGCQRIHANGRTVADVEAVVRAKAREWDSERMRRYVRPSTLFGEHFEEYLADAKRGEGRGEELEDAVAGL